MSTAHETVIKYPDGYQLTRDVISEATKGAGYQVTYRLRDNHGQELAFLLIDENAKTMVKAKTPAKKRITAQQAGYIIPFLKEGKYSVSSWVCDVGIIQQDEEYYYEDNLPEGFHRRDGLNLKDCYEIRRLPRGLTIDGTLYLEDCDIEELPDDLTVHARIATANCFTLRRIGKNCKVHGHLALYQMELESIGDGLQVNGTLSITNKPFPLPNQMNIGGDFYLVGDFEYLPAGLKVGGDLNIELTKITQIPKDAVIGGNIISKVAVGR